jgi:hypothetical protein
VLSSQTNRRRVLALLATALAIAGGLVACGGSGGSRQIVDEATLSGVESGKLDLSLGIDTKGSKGGHVDVGLSGPFERGDGVQATKLDLTGTAKGTVNGKKVDFEGGLTLLGGSKSYVEFEGTDYKVDSTTFGFVNSAIGESEEVSSCREALSERKLSEFIANPVEEGTVDVGGTSTTKVSGDVDPEALNEALNEANEDALCAEQMRAIPGARASLEAFEESPEGAQGTVSDAHITLYVGDDHIVRRLQAKVTLEPPAGKAPKGVGSAEFDVDLTLADVNEPQKIAAPQGAKPLTALFIKLGINPVELLGVVQGGVTGGGLSALLERLVEAGEGQ